MSSTVAARSGAVSAERIVMSRASIGCETRAETLRPRSANSSGRKGLAGFHSSACALLGGPDDLGFPLLAPPSAPGLPFLGRRLRLRRLGLLGGLRALERLLLGLFGRQPLGAFLLLLLDRLHQLEVR